MKRVRTSLRSLGREHGQSLVFMGLATFFLLFMVAIVSETAFIWMQRRNLQNAADAAALAGAQRLPEEPGAAITDAKDWAAKNVAGLTSNEAEVFNGNLAIRSTVRKRASTLFVGRFSFGAPEITAKAAAMVRGAQLPGPGVQPMAVVLDEYGPGGEVTLKEYSGNNSDPASSYRLLDLPEGSGANDVCDFLIGGGKYITNPVNAKPGNVSSLHNCLVVRMNAAAIGPRVENGSYHPCLSSVDVLLGDRLNPVCDPLNGAQKNGDGVQPTAVVLVPVVKAFCQGACDLYIEEASPPANADSNGPYYQFAYFLIDLKTVQQVGDDGPTCAPPPGGSGDSGKGKNKGGGNDDKSQPPGQCWITGQFILGPDKHPVGASGQQIVDYGPNTLVKVVQLIE